MTIDERLEFLLQSTESLHSTATQQTAAIAELVKRAEKSDQRWEMLRRALAGALTVSLGPEKDKGGQAQSD